MVALVCTGRTSAGCRALQREIILNHPKEVGGGGHPLPSFPDGVGFSGQALGCSSHCLILLILWQVPHGERKESRVRELLLLQTPPN